MNKFQGVQRITQLVSFSLITTFVLLMHVNFARGEGLGIGPNQEGFDQVTLFASQGADFDTTTTSPFSSHSVMVVSYFNRILKASLEPRTEGGTGFWWIMVFGTGGDSFVRKYSETPRVFQFTYGAIWPNLKYTKKSDAWCDIDPVSALALAIGGVYLSSPVSAEEPFAYRVKIATTAHNFDDDY
ncbi:MAG: hypothetical protein JRF49_12475 [Deltaproteobacteria bacterium]|nr:hypothetical protein [Deltaproteobacteria bacterium]